MSDETENSRLDDIIERLMIRNSRIRIPMTDVLYLISESKSVFQKEPIVLELKPPINICGDIHGQYSDLLRLLDMNPPLPQTRYLFLGDYVDRGPQSLEVICLLLALKLKYPDNIYMIRGNHECQEMTELYGFARECVAKQSKKVYLGFCELFNWMPIVAIISHKIFCVHGGLSPVFESLEQIKAIKRPTTIPDTGLLADLLWSDPEKRVKEWGPSERGVTFVWGWSPAKRFLEANKFSVLVRAHQLAMNGIEFPFAPERSVITVFSAPGYAGEFRNKGAFLKVDQNLVITTSILHIEKKSPKAETMPVKRPGTGPPGGRMKTPVGKARPPFR